MSDPAPLNGRPDLYLSFTQQYKILKEPKTNTYRITTRYYSYMFEREDAQEILGYHWHPDGVSPVTFPHLHLGPAALIGRVELIHKAHLPTGRVAFEDLVEFVVATFEVEPERNGRRSLGRQSRSLTNRRRGEDGITPSSRIAGSP